MPGRIEAAHTTPRTAVDDFMGSTSSFHVFFSSLCAYMGGLSLIGRHLAEGYIYKTPVCITSNDNWLSLWQRVYRCLVSYPFANINHCPLSSWAASLCKGEFPIIGMSSIRLEPLQKSLLMGKGGPFHAETASHEQRSAFTTTVEGAEGKVFLFLFLRSAEAIH